MIVVDGLEKRYGRVVALRGVSFEVGRGEVVGFLGPNGAGKSTTMKILTTFLNPSGGRAEVGGFSVREQPLEVRRVVGYLPEHAPLYLDMRACEYLDYAARCRQLGDRRERRRAIARVTERCALFEVIGRRIHQLSKGYRQRVGLAQAMLHDPPVLILDEPTSGLDPIQIQEIRRVIREIGRTRTVIFSTHIIPEIEQACDRVIVIDRGELVGAGTPDQLKAACEGASLVLRWRGERAALEASLADDGGWQLREIDELIEARKPAAESDAAELDRLAASLAGSGRLAEARREEASLEEAFFQLVGRRAE